MVNHIEQTLVLLKPDAVERALSGKIIGRLEDAGFKIVGLKMIAADVEKAGKHYHDVEERHGKDIFRQNVEFLTSGPVIAIVLEGVSAIENIRKLAGTTEPKSANPGTIRGDYSHVSYGYANDNDIVTKNVIHASADAKDAKREIAHWFSPTEIIIYQNVHEKHTR